MKTIGVVLNDKCSLHCAILNCDNEDNQFVFPSLFYYSKDEKIHIICVYEFVYIYIKSNSSINKTEYSVSEIFMMNFDFLIFFMCVTSSDLDYSLKLPLKNYNRRYSIM